MDTLSAYARAQAAKGREPMIFDWDKAAALIQQKAPRAAFAGLQSDWEYTGGCIYRDGSPVKDGDTYLGSNWAVPELDLDGEIIECFRMQSEAPDWDPDTPWPDSALKILRGESA